MATETQVVDIGVIYVGKEICVEVRFDTNTDLSNAYVTLDVPNGVTYSRTVLPRGSYNPVTNVWDIGTVLGSENALVGLVCFEVSDAAYNTFTFQIIGGAVGACESCLEGNTKCVSYVGINCDDLENCVVLTNVGPNIVRLTDGGATIDIAYWGETAPSSFVESPVGTFTLTVPAGVQLATGVFIGSDSNVNGTDQITFNFVDTDGRTIDFVPGLVDLSTNTQLDLQLNGHNPTHDDSVAGTMTSIWQNVGYDDFKILFSFLNMYV